MDDLLDSGQLHVRTETPADIKDRLTAITMSACEHCVAVCAAAGACVLAVAIWIYYR